MWDSDGGLGSFGGELSERKRGRLRRASPSIACLVGAVVLLALIGDADVDSGNLWAIPALALMWTAVTIPAWRRGGGPRDAFGPQALRLRRLHTRVHFRATILLAYASLALLWVASYAHFEWSDEYDTTNPATDSAHYSSYAGWSLWLLAAAAVPLLVQPLTWQLWPRAVRMAVRGARMAAKDARSARTPFIQR
ncbi:hypothetical protein [Actinospica robiniae]|uniref:hypothetical protein n=1 Tax=Actinospica robiniae TaxID=304901 RepID=UPI000558D78C|nr:hypothetical protein [Actinospica robiniae]